MPDAASLSDAFLQQSPACHWIVDSGGVFRRIYGDCSPLFGKAPVELLERTAAQTLEPDLAAAWKDRYARVFAGESLKLRDRRGDTVWNISLSPIRLEGAIRFAGALACEATGWSSAEKQLRDTVVQALDTQESERKMVSRFLHDSIGQNLTALGLQLDLVRMDLESISPAVGSRVAEIQLLLGQMMEEVREYMHEMIPSTVDRTGLGLALERLIARIRLRFTGVLRAQVEPSLRLDPKVASALYRIAQEAAENALQHSGCSTLEIALQSTRTGTSLEVRDDGRGFDSGDLAGGYRGLGLLSMEHYAAQAGLELSVASSRESGTIVRAITPAAV